MIYKKQLIKLAINGVTVIIELDISQVQQIIPIRIIADSLCEFKVEDVTLNVKGELVTPSSPE